MADFLTSIPAWLVAVLQTLAFVAGAPLLAGWIKLLKARLQNRRGADVFQPYRDLRKLLAKETLVAHTASPIFRAAPYLVFGATLIAASVVPLFTLAQPISAIADAIVLIGLLGLARFFLALAAMDVGTAFGGMGASREMMISSLAEPAILIAIFTLAMSAHSTSLASMMGFVQQSTTFLRPSYLFALLAFLLVAVAETGRVPVDNPATHLELTMVHEAMILEYSGPHLALMEWAAQVKLMLFGALIANLFFPWGLGTSTEPLALLFGVFTVASKLLLLGVVLAVSETVLAKMRLFRVPAYLNLAFLLALLGVLSFVILEVGA